MQHSTYRVLSLGKILGPGLNLFASSYTSHVVVEGLTSIPEPISPVCIGPHHDSMQTASVLISIFWSGISTMKSWLATDRSAAGQGHPTQWCVSFCRIIDIARVIPPSLASDVQRPLVKQCFVTLLSNCGHQ